LPVRFCQIRLHFRFSALKGASEMICEETAPFYVILKTLENFSLISGFRQTIGSQQNAQKVAVVFVGFVFAINFLKPFFVSEEIARIDEGGLHTVCSKLISIVSQVFNHFGRRASPVVTTSPKALGNDGDGFNIILVKPEGSKWL
jgi:hypothetical protein